METAKIDAEETWKLAWTYIRTIVDTLREPFLILDADLRVIAVNQTFYRLFQVKPEETEGKLVYELGDGQWNIPSLKELLEKILPENTYFEEYKVEHEFPTIGKKIFLLNARRIFKDGENDAPIILLAMEDITERKRLEDELRDYANKLNQEVARRTQELEVRVQELERLNKIMVDRELKMIALKKEIGELKEKK